MKTKTYRKPDFTMMRFAPSDNVAACTSQSTETTTYESQEITCIIDGSEYVFYSECKSNVSSGYLGYYDGDLYFVWYDGNASTIPTTAQTNLLTAIENAVGATDAVGKPGWHAGKATATISSIFSSSY